jgi:hypothetical protein
MTSCAKCATQPAAVRPTAPPPSSPTWGTTLYR